MGLGMADIDNDNDIDLFLSNAGNSIPSFLVSGDLREDQAQNLEWLVLQNDGTLEFSDITKDVDADGFGFAWGGVFEDVNLDGAQDLVVAQNYVKWPLHKLFKLPGKVLLGDSKNVSKFYTDDSVGNKHLAQHHCLWMLTEMAERTCFGLT